MKRCMAVVVALIALSGCGGDSKTAPTSAAPTSAATTSTASTTTSIPATAPAATLTTEPATTPDSTPTTSAATTTTVAAPTKPLTIDELLALGRPIVLAHAGGEDEHPHSTPYGYAESFNAGVDMLDFDVQLTKDGVLVVQHDDDVSRTTNGTGKIADMTYAELNKLDNAYWFTDACTCTGQPDAAYTLRGIRTGDKPPPAGYTPDDFIIPRFSDIVQRFPTMPLNIEIKGNGDLAIAAAKELAKELTDLGRLSNSVVTSFDDAVVTAFHGFAPTVELTPGLGLSSAWILDHTPLPAGMRILQLPPEYSGIHVLTADSIAASHAAGYVIWVWPNDHTYENPDGYKKLLDIGMDGLNINYPDQGVAAVNSFTGKG